MNPSQQPIVTVIIPSFNQVRFVERAIVSVLDQGYERTELIVADGGSCDGGLEIIRTYESDLAAWWSLPDAGPADAVNSALARATGEIVMILDADDVMAPFALHQIVQRFAQSDEPAWIVGNVRHMNVNDRAMLTPTGETVASLDDCLRLGPGAMESPVCAYRRDVLGAYTPLDLSLLHAWRYDLHCRMLADGVIPTKVDTIVGHRRVHATSMSARDREGYQREHGRVTLRYRHEQRARAMTITAATDERTEAA